MVKCKTCPREITTSDIADAPELSSGQCNWCNPQQIPQNLRLNIGNGIYLRKGSLCPDRASVKSCVQCQSQGFECNYKNTLSKVSIVTLRIKDTNIPKKQVGN